MNSSCLKSIIFLVIVLHAYTCIVRAAKKRRTRTSAIIEDIQTCVQNENVTLNYTFHGKDDYRINLSIYQDTPVEDIAYYNQFDRCESEQSCETFLKIPMDDFCKFVLKMDAQVWSVFLDNFEPKIRCPVQGLYSLKEYRIYDAVKKLTEFGSLDAKTDRYHYHWTMKFIHKPTKKEFVCIKVKGYLKQMRTS